MAILMTDAIALSSNSSFASLHSSSLLSSLAAFRPRICIVRWPVPPPPADIMKLPLQIESMESTRRETIRRRHLRIRKKDAAKMVGAKIAKACLEKGEKPSHGFDGGEAFRILEDQCKNDAELREIVGDCIVDPELSQKRVESRVKRKERTLLQRKLGSPVHMAVSFRDFDPHDSCIWLELYDLPTEDDVELLGNVFRSWYIIGHLGSFNSLNIQLTRASPEKNLNYNSNYADMELPCNFHNTSNLEFQNKWGRIWVDLGTSDPLPWDILINSLASVSSDHIGIKQLIFGGEGMGGWQENMTNSNLNYKVYKI